jgi:hypothetical protein
MIDLKIEDSLLFYHLLNDNEKLYLNQYGKIFTSDEIGSFDIIKLDNKAVLEFIQ